MIKRDFVKSHINNSGFSLVELIIVIAIMAVLVGTVGMQVIPYLNQAKHAKDVQILSAIGTAGVAAYSEKVDFAPLEGQFTITITPGSDSDIYTSDDAQEVADKTKELVGVDYLTVADSKFVSKEFHGIDEIRIVFDLDNYKTEVQAYKSGDKVTKDQEVTGKL